MRRAHPLPARARRNAAWAGLCALVSLLLLAGCPSPVELPAQQPVADSDMGSYATAVPPLGLVPDPAAASCNFNLPATGLPGALARLNQLRLMGGLAPLGGSGRLQAAAVAHANYLLANHLSGHDESPELRGFFGARPLDRFAAAGYSAADQADLGMHGEIVAAGHIANEADSVDFLMSIPYHRMVALDHEARDAGAARPCNAAGQGFEVIDIGALKGSGPGPLTAPAVWPPDGATGVWTMMGRENPNPLAPAEWCDPDCPGYPASVQVPASRAGSVNVLNVARFSIVRRGGSEVPVRVLGRDDPIVAHARHWAVAIPLQPLQPGATYDVLFSGSDNAGAFSKAWSFTTSAAHLRMTDSQAMADGVALHYDAAAPFIQSYRLAVSDECRTAGAQVRLTVGSRVARLTLQQRPQTACNVWVTVTGRVAHETTTTLVSLAP